MPMLLVGETGTLQFVPGQAGLDPAVVQSVSWQPQGAQTAVKFTPPSTVQGLAPGVGNYKVTVTLTTPGEKVTYAFTVDCVAPAPPPSAKAVPVTIHIGSA